MASSSSSSRRLRAFKRWMSSHGFQYNALEFTDNVEQGISVRAMRDLKEGEVVATIPKAACLTPKTSAARDLIEVAELGGSLALSVAIMYEKSLGENSPWAGYLQLLPERECLPVVWSLDEVDQLLGGTELHKTLKDDKAFMYEDWKENILPLMDSLPSNIDRKFFGVEQYFCTKSLLASRSFQIDSFHGSGMVPLADLFNHKTDDEDVHFTCVSPHFESEEDDDDGDINGAYADNGGQEEPSSDLKGSSINGDDPMVLEMIMVKDVKAGTEVFNTYGSVGNAALLHRYGFTETDNPHNIVNIDLELVLEWSSSVFSGRYSRARLSLWRKLGYSGCVSQSSEYFEISSNGQPQIELLILLYIMLLPEDAYNKLDLKVSTANDYEGCASMIALGKCNSTKDNSLEAGEDLLLTEGVCNSLLCLADKRESFYGVNSIEDDIEALEKCSRKERKLYHSLVLRISERKVLKKLRVYASAGARLLKATNRTSKMNKRKKT